MTFCSLIVNGGTCVNATSEDMVAELKLPTTVHPKPYQLQWVNDRAFVKVVKKVKVSIKIGMYEDELVCDVVRMQATHILLGRPWKYDKNSIHYGKANKYPTW